MIVIWRIALIALALIIGWRVLLLGLGAHFASTGDGSPAKPDAALAWDQNQRQALAELAAQKAETSPGEAAEIWAELLRTDPTNTAALLGLANTAKDEAKSDALVTTATSLNSASPSALKRAAAHWVQRGDLEKALTAWSGAMIADSRARKGLYPILQKLFEDPRTRSYLTHYAEQPPEWWNGFFRYVTQHTADTEVVRGLYALRRSPAAFPISLDEREAYIERLRKDGLTTEAYLTWVNGLDDIQRQGLGLINNGSFEAAPSGTGWDWRFRQNKHLVIENAATYGTDGNQALHVAFRQFDQRFSHVRQELFLEPGSYILSGKARPNGLKTTGGLQWAIDCLDGPGRATRIATTDRFLGSSQWEPFDLEFEIHQDCPRPELRLINSVRVSTDTRMDGSIWFDGLRIKRIVKQAPEE